MEEIQRRAEAGSCVAQTLLGIAYLYGYEVEINYSGAFRFLSAAASQGASRAVLNLGLMHAKGLGIPQNLYEAVRLLESVAKPSDSSDAFAARMELGRLYSGLGAPPDSDKALFWYEAAIALSTGGEESVDVREAREYLAKRKTPDCS
jgi:TPR repeat protein